MVLSDINPIVSEALNAAYDYEITSDKRGLRVASFQSKGREIVVAIEKSVTGNWQVIFAENRILPSGSKTEVFSATGLGDEFRVFATVSKIIKDFVSQREQDVDRIYFTSEKSEKSRTRLYYRMMERFSLPGWEREINSQDSDFRTYFTFKRKTDA